MKQFKSRWCNMYGGVCTKQTSSNVFLHQQNESCLSFVRHLCSTTSLLFSHIFLPRSKCCENCSFPSKSCCNFGDLAINCAALLYIHYVLVPQVQKIMGTTGRGKRRIKFWCTSFHASLPRFFNFFQFPSFCGSLYVCSKPHRMPIVIAYWVEICSDHPEETIYNKEWFK